MDCIDFDNFTKNNKLEDVYRNLWKREPGLPVLRNNVIEKSRTSAGKVNSYCFDVKESVADSLIKQFGITKDEYIECFRSAFKEACGGSGNEIQKITTLHSSSLCALLHFYLVPKKSCTLEIHNNEYVFHSAFFEVKNRVTRTWFAPSNVDVVLIGNRKNNEKERVVLFLESKFTEYIEYVGKTIKIPISYKDDNDYGKLIYEKLGSEDTYRLGDYKKNPEKYFTLESDKGCYLDGIKQIISHYIGIRNLFEDIKNPEVSEKIKTAKPVVDAIKEGAKVYLGEIVFTNGIKNLKNDNSKTYFEDYEERYKKMSQLLNSVIEKSSESNRFEVYPELFEYNDDFVNDDLIREFYYSC